MGWLPDGIKPLTDPESESESVGYLVDLLVEYGTKGVRAAYWQPRASSELAARGTWRAAGQSLCLKQSKDGASAVSLGRVFHSIRVLEKNENL